LTELYHKEYSRGLKLSLSSIVKQTERKLNLTHEEYLYLMISKHPPSKFPMSRFSERMTQVACTAGWHRPEYEAFGYPFDHLAIRFDEALQIIVPLLREGHVDFQGQYYQVHNCVLRPRGPSPTGPRILIGARRPRMVQLVA
jgi:hypothetical protein